MKINRQGFEKRVVSQDLQLWLSNVRCIAQELVMFQVFIYGTCFTFPSIQQVPPVGDQFTLVARAGRQVLPQPYSSPSLHLSVPLSEHKSDLQVQEILLITSLDQEGIKRALQRVLERVP